MGPWGIALVVGLPLAAVETLVVALSYRDLGLSDRAAFVAFYGMSLACTWTLALGAGGRLFGLLRKPIGVGAALGALVFLLARLALMLHTAHLAVLGPLGALGAGGCVAVAVLLGLVCGWMSGRWTFRVPAAPLAPLAFGGLAFLLFATRAVPDVVQSPLAQPRPPTDSPLSAGKTNVLLITIDTLRADHLDAYGYPRRTAPFLHSLAEKGVLFERAVSQRTNTSPSIATLLTGTYPPTHRVLNNGQKLQDFNLTLAEVLHGAGYRTVASISNPGLLETSNYNQGFDIYNHPEHLNRIQDDELLESRNLNEVALPALDQVKDDSFFMWIHYRDPHTPYLVPDDYAKLFTKDDYASRHGHYRVPVGKGGPGTMLRSAVVDGNNDLDWLIAQYDSEIVFNDQSIQALVQHLAEIGRDRDTLIIVTADHGESMGEHQQLYFEHGTLTTETNAHVPLIFYHPKLPRGLRVKQTVSLVDVGPTILDLLGLGVPHTMQGESFAPLVLGRAFEHRRKDHFIIARYRYGYQSHAVTTDNYKLVLQADPRWLPLDSVVGFLGELWLPEQSFNVYHFRKLDPQLYDLRSDPDEQTNLAGRGLPVEQELRRELWRWIEEAYREGQGRKTMAADFDQETVDALRALGYGDIEAHPQAPREPAPASDRP